MKKIINRKKYDTETAKRLGSWDNSHYPSDFEYCAESLYQRKDGAYFLHGEGGALSKYATDAYGGGRTWGEDITPLTQEEAMDWSEAHLDADDYAKIWGEPLEYDNPIEATADRCIARGIRDRAGDHTDITALDIMAILKATGTETPKGEAGKAWMAQIEMAFYLGAGRAAIHPIPIIKPGDREKDIAAAAKDLEGIQ